MYQLLVSMLIVVLTSCGSTDQKVLPGPVGPQGDKGDVGAQGSSGATGQTGATGTTGAAGTAGATGATGSAGAKGSAGSNGATGSQGAVGPSGAAGQNGKDGVSIAFSVRLALVSECAHGGTVLSVWLDVNGNGVYDKGDKNLTLIPICEASKKDDEDK